MIRECAKCKQPSVLPTVADKRRPYVCDSCWEKVMREAAERIRIKVR